MTKACGVPLGGDLRYTDQSGHRRVEGMMETLAADLPKLISIFGLAFFYFWPSIPAGLALGLPPPLVVAASSLSYACGAAAVTLVGGPLRMWILRRIGRQSTLDPNSLIGRLSLRFGPAGLGLAAPMTVGAQIGAALGLALDISPRWLFLWLSAGGLLWSILLTLGVSLLGLGGAGR